MSLTNEYNLFNARASGWLTSGGVYTSERKDAQRFTHEKAIDMCKVHYNNGFTEFGLIPVLCSDLLLIATK